MPIPISARRAARRFEEGHTPRALVVPHAGFRWSGDCAGAAFRLLIRGRYERVVLLGPSHHVRLRGAALPEDDAFATPLGSLPFDGAAVAALSSLPGFTRSNRPHEDEHALEIELPFLQQVLGCDFKLLPLVVGNLDVEDREAVARGLAPYWRPDTLWVVSSDFTHFGHRFDHVPFHDRVPERLRTQDVRAIERLAACDLDGFESFLAESAATICGRDPLRVLMQVVQGHALAGECIDYYRSGDKTGDFENSVSYAGIAFYDSPTGAAGADSGEDAAVENETRLLLLPVERRYLLGLARRSLESAVSGHAIDASRETRHARSLFGADTAVLGASGVFVTLRAGEELRGCIGRVESDRPVVEGVIGNARSAALRDTRFDPVAVTELAGLTIEVSVLTPPARVMSPDLLRLGRDGVVLEKRGHRAVFLPEVPLDQGWNREELLTHLSRKAGLDADAWREGAKLFSFRTQAFSETAPRDGD